MIPEGYRGVIYIMRGVPGSGKSHLGLRLAGGDASKVFSTDDYFERMEGGYRANWKMDRLFPAHRWNQGRVRAAMQKGITPIVVDNTNITMKQARPYIEMAIQYQYLPEIHESDSPWWKEISELLKNKSVNKDAIAAWASKLANGFEHEGKIIQNVHGVPQATIQDMLNRLNQYTVKDVKDRIKQGPE